MAAIPQDLGTLPDSRYAAERRRIDQGRPFSCDFESEFLAARLMKDRTLIRAAACLALLIVSSRFISQSANGEAHGLELIQLGAVEAGCIVLLWLAFGAVFERHYLRWAEIIVPVRNTMAAAHFAAVAASGRVELFMVLPMLIMGPFFFSGLRYRVALGTGVAALSAFALMSALTLPHAVAVRCGLSLLIVLIGSAVAARHVETGFRERFLERYLIEELAQRDALTGALNRRAFDESFSRIWSQAVQGSRLIAIVLIDVDHFKAYNDRYGHLAGDDALRGVARAVQSFIQRPGDILARYGGEEFAAVLQGADGEQAKLVAERMRRAVMDLGIEHRASATCESLTISVGVAAIQPSLARDCRGALQLADQALYQAKVNGRNGVELLDEAAYQLLRTGVFRTVGAHTMLDKEATPSRYGAAADGRRRAG
ncbi:MAG: diguanylate cyclase [Steroidobacteraceae bacterium]